ncbi:bifunctional diaminohydroxyphosphoribosylaminopyrimidine deaminase/5-amino-6-(5-phosphoribosylamino)uracil reductase RibD [Lysobacter korlensis]|uniref:Riboflavin biosynthesis protein RibD n=1 Tax=Lysobacter korlensis TaxID=553636 RepID=A0ABV6S1I7_9GAMM
MTDFEQAMRHALALASHGPVTGGNPQVGCVLIDENGSRVAEGWHRGAGTAHAEVDALSRLAAAGRSDASGLTAVVILEPCNHHGRTGPCAGALLDAGVARVVYAVPDPGAASAGGAERLAAAGVEVIGGVLRAEVEDFLRPWLTATRLGRPHVVVKWASTLDGRAAADDGTSQWITGEAARQRVHEQRSQVDAILVGTGTVLADDPSLTARGGDYGEFLPFQPLPVVIGERPVPADAKLRSHPAGLLETGTRDLDEVLRDLYARGIRRVLVEGGPTLASAFLEADLADELSVYLAPVLLGGGRLAVGDIGVPTLAAAKRLTLSSVESLGGDLLVIARPTASASQPAGAPVLHDTVKSTATTAAPAAAEKE